jgi:hypothetical protein
LEQELDAKEDAFQKLNRGKQELERELGAKEHTLQELARRKGNGLGPGRQGG